MAKTGKAGAALKRSPVHLLHRALQLGLELYADEVGAKGVTQRQFAVLSAVAAEDGLSQTQLVRMTGIDRSTVAELVNRMTKQGLLARSRIETDARTNAVRLTEAGVAVAPGIAFGEYGEGYVRIGLVENEHRIKQAARNVKKFIANADSILAKAHNTVERG